MDFRAAVLASLDSLIASGEVEKAIEAALAKTIATVIQDELRSYSDFGKRLAEAVKASLALNGELDLPSYNQQILQIVRKQVQGYTEAVIQKQVAENLQELLVTPPAEITLSDLVAQYRKHVKDQKSGGCVCYGDRHAVTLHLEEDRYGSGFRTVYLADEADQPVGKCDIQIGVHREKVYHLTFRNVDVESRLFSGPIYGFERSLFQMKAAGTKLIIDRPVDEIETEVELAEV